jgi:hypothetical protein
MMKHATQPVITSRIGNRVVECPVSLLTQLQHERMTHHIGIESGIGEAESDALLSEAEHIKDKASNISDDAESGT